MFIVSISRVVEDYNVCIIGKIRCFYFCSSVISIIYSEFPNVSVSLFWSELPSEFYDLVKAHLHHKLMVIITFVSYLQACR